MAQVYSIWRQVSRWHRRETARTFPSDCPNHPNSLPRRPGAGLFLGRALSRAPRGSRKTQADLPGHCLSSRPARSSSPWLIGSGKSCARPSDKKQAEYRDLGVREYWIVDRFRRQMTVYAWRGGKWGKRVIAEAETHTTALLPGFTPELRRLLAFSDRHQK